MASWPQSTLSDERLTLEVVLLAGCGSGVPAWWGHHELLGIRHLIGEPGADWGLLLGFVPLLYHSALAGVVV
jgi:hypothetical protein